MICLFDQTKLQLGASFVYAHWFFLNYGNFDRYTVFRENDVIVIFLCSLGGLRYSKRKYDATESDCPKLTLQSWFKFSVNGHFVVEPHIAPRVLRAEMAMLAHLVGNFGVKTKSDLP